MLKDVLVHIDNTSAGALRLVYALELASRHGALVTGVHVTPPADPPTVFKPSMVEGVSDELAQRHMTAAIKAMTHFHQVIALRGAKTRWLALEGDMISQLCEAARFTDLVVLGQYEHQGPAERHPLSVAEGVVLKSGRPVLVVPADVKSAHLRHALIAWDGSREAVRAFHDALPLLQRASTLVEIVTFGDDPPPNLEPLTEHLAHHNIEVDRSIHARAEGETGAALAKRIRSGHFDLLVMGAYGQPAWLEFLFGGTTASALQQSSAPVLLSH
jgi:nucleotide-binding universal stress UspA family protein